MLVDEVDSIIVDDDPVQHYLIEDYNKSRELQDVCDKYFKQKQSVQQIEAKINHDHIDVIREFKNALVDVEKMEKDTYHYKLQKVGDEYRIVNSAGLHTNQTNLALKIYNYKKSSFTRLPLFDKMVYALSVPYIFNQHLRIIGFSGSIGNKTEQSFVNSTYGCIFIKVPIFLECCKLENPLKKKLKQKDILAEENKEKQFSKIMQLAVEKAKDVPVLIILEDEAEVQYVVEKYRELEEQMNVLTLSKFLQSRQQFSQGIEKVGERWNKQFRISVCTPFGARG